MSISPETFDTRTFTITYYINAKVASEMEHAISICIPIKRPLPLWLASGHINTIINQMNLLLYLLTPFVTCIFFAC